jgi:hypothetical protein
VLKVGEPPEVFARTLAQAIAEVRTRRSHWREVVRTHIRAYTFPRTTDGLLAALQSLSSP